MIRRISTMTGFIGNVGFAAPIVENRLSRRRAVGLEMIATATLAISLIVAATAISIGVARAQVALGHDHRGPIVVATGLAAVTYLPAQR
jgi:hypothetical protein